jgi:ketosteroid isomerase-like protein
MSEENVKRVRALYEHLARGNLRGAGGDLLSPDLLFEPIWDGRQTFVGVEAFAAQMREFLEQWDDFRIQADSFEDLGDAVMVTEVQRATGRASGIETKMSFVGLWRFSDGLVTSARWYRDRASALEAADAG